MLKGASPQLRAIAFMLAPFFALTICGISTCAAEQRPACAPVVHAGHRYTVCEAPLDRYAIRFYWQQPDGKPYNYLSALPKTAGQGERLAFALNGGMFDPDYRPVGLYIEGGRQLRSINTNAGSGNFHLKPNGVFYVAGQEAGVLETGAFLKRNPKAEFATQSGPMLVIAGKLHPRISTATSSEKQRDGVCVRDKTVALFAISEENVSFADFLRFFRDKLKCRDALFLDGGSAPALYVPSQKREGNSFVALGPMIAVYEKGGAGALP